MAEEYGYKIKEARVKANLSQEELAKLTGVRIATICEIETGKANPTVKTLRKITKCLNLNLI